MTTHRPVLLILGALTLGCNPENDIIDIGDDTGVETVVRPPLEGDLYVAPEEPRFYLIDVPAGTAVSDNGVVLTFDPLTGGDVYLWTEDEGLEWVTTTGAYFNSVDDISADGTKIIGNYGNYMIEGETTQAATWTRTDGWTKLGAMPGAGDCPMQSAGWALTPDGSVGAGLAFGVAPGGVPGVDNGCSAYGFRWDATNGFVPYQQVGNGGNRVTQISDNGEMAVGFAQGNSRTPAAWFADGSGQVLNINWNGEFYGVNATGTKAVGNLGAKAIVWERGVGHSFLGNLGAPGEDSSVAIDICGADDELIIGNDSIAGGVATVWTGGEQYEMTEWLESLGVELPANTRLTSATDCSPDKRFIIGQGSVDEASGVWVAILPEHVFETP